MMLGGKVKGRCGRTAVGMASKLDVFTRGRREAGQKPEEHVSQARVLLFTCLEFVVR